MQELDLRKIIPATGKRRDYKGYAADVCPFHSDQNPSFLIWAHGYKCLGCHVSGTLYDYVTKFLKRSIAEFGDEYKSYTTWTPPEITRSLPMQKALDSFLMSHPRF